MNGLVFMAMFTLGAVVAFNDTGWGGLVFYLIYFTVGLIAIAWVPESLFYGRWLQWLARIFKR